MKTIEERAKSKANAYLDVCVEQNKRTTVTEDFANGYIKGATEQKAIDDAESGKELLYVVNKTTERVRKEMIEKACEWLRENVRPYYKFSIDSFRQAMEE